MPIHGAVRAEVVAELKNAFNTQQLSSINTTTTTDATGHYLFPGLGPGTYFVEVVPPAGSTTWVATPSTSSQVAVQLSAPVGVSTAWSR